MSVANMRETTNMAALKATLECCFFLLREELLTGLFPLEEELCFLEEDLIEEAVRL